MRKLVSVFLNIFIHLINHQGCNQFLPLLLPSLLCSSSPHPIKILYLNESPCIASYHPLYTPSSFYLGFNSLSTSPLDSDIPHQPLSPYGCLLTLLGLDTTCQLIYAHGHISCHNCFWRLTLVLFLYRCPPHIAWALVVLSKTCHVWMLTSVRLDSDSPYQAAH